MRSASYVMRQTAAISQPEVSRKARFAERLRRLRVARGYSKARHFAQELGIRENRYTRYERGASEPDIDLIYAFCDKLGVTPNELFGLSDAARPQPAMPPGFSSGPQAELVRDDGPALPASEAPGADARPALPAGSGNGSERDAAAWALAHLVVRQRRATGDGAAARQPLADLAETARLYQALRATPYEAVARLLVDPAIAGLPGPAAAEIEALVSRLVPVG